MNILSFDTSNSIASVAILNDKNLASYNNTKQSSQQAEKLFQLINLSLNEADTSLEKIDLISVTNGPGSFTGIRIALSAALGIRASIPNKKIISLSNFQVVAWQAREYTRTKDIAVILDARQDHIYLQLFDNNLNEISSPSLLAKKEISRSILENFFLIGDGVKLVSDNKIDLAINVNANAEILAKATIYFWKKNKYSDLIPLYVRQAYVS